MLKNWSPKSFPEDFPGNTVNQESHISLQFDKGLLQYWNTALEGHFCVTGTTQEKYGTI